MFQELIAYPVSIPIDEMKDGDLKRLKIAFACFALAKVAKK